MATMPSNDRSDQVRSRQAGVHYGERLLGELVNKKNIAFVGGIAALFALAAAPVAFAGGPSDDGSTFGYVSGQPTVPAMTVGSTASFAPVGSVEPTAATTLSVPSASPTLKAAS
jgi:hypothetical protein